MISQKGGAVAVARLVKHDPDFNKCFARDEYDMIGKSIQIQ